MNETCRNLTGRRSIRAFRPEQLLENELQEVLDAGLAAPSGGNRQSAVLVAVQDRETVRRLSAMNAEVLGKPDLDPFYGAPTVVVVLADRHSPTWKEDGSLVLGNLMNAAWSMGIGSCWIHRAREVFESEEGRKLLASWGLSDDYVGVGHCILGYPDEEPADIPRRENRLIRV